MEYFAGLDVSLEETAICIVDETGRIVREVRTGSEPEALVTFFRACGFRMERVGLEACSLAAWLHAGLTEAGLPAICIEARQAKAAMSAMPNVRRQSGRLPHQPAPVASCPRSRCRISLHPIAGHGSPKRQRVRHVATPALQAPLQRPQLPVRVGAGPLRLQPLEQLP